MAFMNRWVTLKRKSHNNCFTIAKGLAIILMVVGHSGCPTELRKYIYSFHMPFFFICSGMFFTPLSTTNDLKSFIKKKIKRLYWPYIKWCIPFMLLHNFFYYINIYNDKFGFNGITSHLYYNQDYFVNSINILLKMNYPPQLLGGFWFLRYLLIGSIFVSIISFTTKTIKNDKRVIIVTFLSLLCGAIVFSYTNFTFFLFSATELLWSSTFYYCGYLMRNLKENRVMIMGCFFLFLIANIQPVVLEFLVVRGAKQMACMFISSITGTIILLYISKEIEKRLPYIKSFLYYAGNNTLEILGLHFISFKLVSLFIIYYRNLPIEHLAEFPIIIEYRTYWIFYTFFGVLLPLIITLLYTGIRFHIIEFVKNYETDNRDG